LVIFLESSFQKERKKKLKTHLGVKKKIKTILHICRQRLGGCAPDRTSL
jgi:hypothetical protein